MDNDKNILTFLKKYNLSIDKFDTYKLAFIHRSFNPKNENNYERLEYLGDAVLEFVVTEYLYNNFSNFNEGKLSAIRSIIVSAKNLSIFAQEIGLSDILLLGKGEEINGGRRKTSILSDTIESLIGAIYICDGIEKVKDFCMPYIINSTESIIKSGDLKNPKTKIQEISQKLFGVLPLYEVVKEEKINGEHYYVMYLKIKDLDFGPVRTNSKRDAEQILAKTALEFFIGL